MAERPAVGGSQSSSKPVFPRPPGGSLAETTAEALLRGLNQSSGTFQEHYASLPNAPQINDLPADAFNLFPQGFDLNQQLQSAREGPMLQALNLRGAFQGFGNVAPSSAEQSRLAMEMQQRAYGQGESSAQNYLKGLLPTISSHKLGAYALQGQRERTRGVEQYLGQINAATNLYATDATRAQGFGGPLVELLKPRQTSQASSFFRGPTA